MSETLERRSEVGSVIGTAGPESTGDIDAVRWPEIAAEQRPGVKARLARSLFRRVSDRLDVRVELPDGTAWGRGGADAPVMRLVRPDAFVTRIGDGGLIGFGEAYMAGDWASDDLAGVLTVFAAQMSTLVPPRLQRLRDLYVQRHPSDELGSVDNAQSNISRHYDLSNELFELFLDPTMTYSSALFDERGGVPVATDELLQQAQERKIDRLLDAVGVTAGTDLLEIGTGWGELATRAAARGANVRSITLSEEQLVLAQQRVAAAGLTDRVSIELCDYRAVHGTYDAVISVEMIEAVGFEYWETYFSTLDRLVRPGGRVGIQAITMPHDRMVASRDTYTWIHKYIFPGGLIPSIESIESGVRDHTRLHVSGRRSFGLHYAETLRIWRERFEARPDEIDALGFDATFRAMWSLYLGYSEAGFRSRYLDVQQFVLQAPAAGTPVRYGARTQGAPVTTTSTPSTTTRTPGHPLVPAPQKAAVRTGAAGRLAALLEPVFSGELPVRLRAWDGSEAGPVDAPVAIIRSRRALRRLLWNPGELGLAQAYVTGDLDVEGDLADGLRRAWALARERGISQVRPTPALLGTAVRTGLRLGAVGPRPKDPSSQAKLSGRLHSPFRDRAAISHHYDLSNDFYQLILDPHMAYSCAYWTSDDPDYTLEDAQRDKLDLVCRKIGLEPGMRFLDVGCGWGSLSIHAAQHYGVQVVGVTLSREQQAFIQARVRDLGLEDRVEIRLQDYREVSDGPFDAIASLEMGEHVGAENYPTYTAGLHRLVKPHGRVLIQQMSRGATNPGGGPFIESYIAPDMFMRPVGQTVDLIEQSGLEVRDVEGMREHYVRTVAAWYRTFEDNYDRAVAMVGEEVARVWRLYLVGGALSFEEGRMGVDQILAVRRAADGTSEMPATREQLLAGGQAG